MTTALFTHESCTKHDPGPMHPESPARLRAVHNVLAKEEFASLLRREAPEASVEQIARVHPRDFVERVLAAVPEEGRVMLDGDTQMSPKSGEAARRGVGAVCSAVDAVMAGEARNAFCAVRPPGHHAEQAISMGFCIFNNVAAGAEHVRKAHSADRVAVVDFDVHHGNGTQAIFWDEPGLFFASTHQMPLYPGTGSASEKGEHDNIVNAPLAPFSATTQFQAAMGERILPALRQFKPDFILISAGFDAHAEDPLAQLNFVEEDYAWATSELLTIAEECCAGRIVSILEGGYNLDALAASVAMHVRVLMEA